MDAPELKPCPFCGGKPYLANVEMAGCAYVVCTDCRMQSDDGSQDRVIAAWSTRAPDPDLDAHIGAVLEEAAGEAANIAAYPKPPLWNYGTTPTMRDKAEWKGRKEAAEDIECAIHALNPIALTALERAKREARVEGMREAAHIAVNACLVPPDGGSPTEEERLVCEEAYRRIMAAALIKAERGKP